jgi:hypothetical protein
MPKLSCQRMPIRVRAERAHTIAILCRLQRSLAALREMADSPMTGESLELGNQICPVDQPEL